MSELFISKRKQRIILLVSLPTSLICIALGFLFSLIVFLFTFWGYTELQAARITSQSADQLFHYPVPRDTEILATETFYGRLHGGNSEHKNILTSLLIRSDLP